MKRTFSLVLSLPIILLSSCIDFILSLNYLSRHSRSTRPIPCLQFRWPNGQGTDKFFNGSSASRRWRHQLGPIYRIWSGMKPEIEQTLTIRRPSVLTEPHQIKQYYRHSHKHIKSVDNNAGWLFHEILGSCVGVVSLGQWVNLRKAVDQPFTRTAAATYTGDFILQVRQYIDNLGDSSRLVFDPVGDMKDCAFLVVAQLFFGSLCPSQRHALLQLGVLREDLFKHTFKGGLNRFSWLRYFPGSAQGQLATFQRRWELFVLEAYQQAAKKPHPQAPIVELWEKVQDGEITKPECLQTLDESLFANLDVTALTTAWALIFLAHNQIIQDALRDEIRKVRADEMEYQQYINSDDTLLASCILESARIRPILSFSNPESATEDHVIDGYTIPHNVDVIIDTHAINVENSFWGPNASTYDPYRFKDIKHNDLRYNLWRFGSGPRQCLGKHVADRLLRTIAAEMVSLFEMRLDDLSVVSSQDDSWIGLPDTKITLKKQ
ncbi:unnamed protein product [Penicillium glandicola]